MRHFPSVSLPPRVSFLCWDATFPRFLQDLYLFYSKAKLGKETAGKGWSQPSSCVAWFYCCWNKGQGKEKYGKNPKEPDLWIFHPELSSMPTVPQLWLSCAEEAAPSWMMSISKTIYGLWGTDFHARVPRLQSLDHGPFFSHFHTDS